MVVLWLGLSLSSVSEHNMWSLYIFVLWLCLSLLSLESKHNASSYQYYGWVCRCYGSSVNTISGGIMVWFVVVFVHP